MTVTAAMANALAAPTPTTAAIAATTATTTTTTTATIVGATNSSSPATVTTTTPPTTPGTVYAVANPAYNTRLRKRHSKRHSNWYEYYNFNENSTTLEWANPCGGFYVPTAVVPSSERVKRKNSKQIYNFLKKSAGNEFKTLLGSQQDIDISNIQIWFLHNYTYKFLPKLKMNSSIPLNRWYRNMQTYVASFAYLRRTQLKWDHSKSQRESRISRELKHLLLSSRSMLCELETAVNNTHPHRPKGKRLKQISRTDMNRHLKLRTKRRMERMTDDVVQEADTIDLKFVKYYYYEFLEKMWKVLRQKTRRKGQMPFKHNQRRTFNEVEEHFGSIARPGDISSGNGSDSANTARSGGGGKNKSNKRMPKPRTDSSISTTKPKS